MQKFKLFFLLFATAAVSAADYPSVDHLWKSFQKTRGSSIHENRVFVRPDQEMLKGKRVNRENSKRQQANLRFRARREVRRNALDLLFRDLVPGESVIALLEKYDLFHTRCYQACAITSRYIYVLETNEVASKGVSFSKYPLDSAHVQKFTAICKELRNSDGSCELIDSRDYPAFLSVNLGKGKWETIVFSAQASVWTNPNEKQRWYFDNVKKIMSVVSEIELVFNSRQVPPVPIRK